MPFRREQRLVAVGFVAAAIGLVVFSAAAGPQEITQRRRVAILNFEDYSGANTGASTVFGAGVEDVGKGISAQLIDKLAAGGKYTVVDRSAVKQLLEEQNRSEFDSMDAYGRAARIGQMLGLDAMIVGAITRFGPDAAPKAGHSAMSTRKSKAYVDITVRVLNMTTGEVMGEFTSAGESARSGDVTIVRGRGQPKAAQQILSGDFIDSLLGDATRDAVEKIAVQLNAFAEKIPLLSIEMEGLVAEVTGDFVTLNLGKKSGVRVGDKFAILRDVRAVTDRETGGSLPVVEQVSEATVTEVAELYATARCSGCRQVRVGDHVKRVTNSQAPSH